MQSITVATPMQTATQTLTAPKSSITWQAALQAHWPEYLIEAAALGTFMISACVFGALLEHPSSPIHQTLQNMPMFRRTLMGLAMGTTAISIISSPWGQRSGAHMNPAVTLTYFTLGRVAFWDALFYILFQFTGGATGVMIANYLIGPALQDSAVNYVVTAPGPLGTQIAFLAEFTISLFLMSTILWVSNSSRLSRFTPFFAGALVATFITVEAPFSGMSMNPARTFGSAFCSGEWMTLWIYFTAPPLAMLLASVIYRSRCGVQAVFCAKLLHPRNQPCIFNCRYGDLHAK